jgi:hypothetical protein
VQLGDARLDQTAAALGRKIDRVGRDDDVADALGIDVGNLVLQRLVEQRLAGIEADGAETFGAFGELIDDALERGLIDARTVAAIEHARAVWASVVAVIDGLDRQIERIIELDLATPRRFEQPTVFAKPLALHLRDDLVGIGVFGDPVLTMAPRAGECDGGIHFGHAQVLPFELRRTDALRLNDRHRVLLTKYRCKRKHASPSPGLDQVPPHRRPAGNGGARAAAKDVRKMTRRKPQSRTDRAQIAQSENLTGGHLGDDVERTAQAPHRGFGSFGSIVDASERGVRDCRVLH